MSGFRPPPLALNGGDDHERAAHAQDPMTPRRMPLPPSASSAYMSKGQGAATPTAEVPSLGYDHNPNAVQRAPQYPPPPSTDSQHVQFASYRNEKPEWAAAPGGSDSEFVPMQFKSWTPLPLRTWFWVIYIILLICVAVALEVALHYNRKSQGWSAKQSFSSQNGVMHYVYTLPPVIISMIITSIWAWTDIEIKKMQPYVDLAHGDAPPRTTLLLDYTRTNNFFVWTRAMKNRHYIVTLSTLMVIMSLVFSPLSAALFGIRDTYLPQDPVNINAKYELGLNEGPAFEDLTAFVTAAGYASASILYGVGPPPWVLDGYAVTPLDIPQSLKQNGTMQVNTTAIHSAPNCVPPETLPSGKRVDLVKVDATGTWENSAVYQGCNFTWTVKKEAVDLFGLDILGNPNSSASTSIGEGCAKFSGMPIEHQPVALWFFTYQTTPPSASITICEPTIELWKVTAEISLTNGNLTKVTRREALSAGEAGAASIASITGAPMEGRAYNGVAFNTGQFAKGDPFVLRRAEATTLQLPAAVVQAARTSSQGFLPTFLNDQFVHLSSAVYEMYLQDFAQTLYFQPKDASLGAQINAWRLRVWLSDVAVHLIATALFIVALFGTIVQILHRGDRRNLRLGHAPGTIASAVAIGGQTDVGIALAGRQREDDIAEALADKRFRIDPKTMKIVMQGEHGYEDVEMPDPRRQSVFGRFQMGLQPRGSPRSPMSPDPRSVPQTPRTPSGAAATSPPSR